MKIKTKIFNIKIKNNTHYFYNFIKTQTSLNLNKIIIPFVKDNFKYVGQV